MKHIVILGGGFAGVLAGKELLRHNLQDVKITLVNKTPYHIFTPSLYEVATSEEPQQNVAIPFKEIFDDKIHVIVDEVEGVQAEKATVKLKKHGNLNFDYLLIALGSESIYFGIKGLEEHAMPLKTLEDAVAIKEKIKSVCCKEGVCHRKANVIVGGGGFSGTELAGELLMYKSRLARQNGLDSNCLEVAIVQGSDRLLKELDPHVSKIATKRISGKQMKFLFGGHIKEVTDSQVLTDDGNAYPYHILIWTGGVGANHVARKSDLPLTDHGQIMVNGFLQVEEFPNIFAAGDIAAFVDPKTQHIVPGVAQVAEEQGQVAGGNIARLIKKHDLRQYQYRHFGYIVPLKGKFAVAEFGSYHMDGFFAWVLQQFVVLRYLWGIMSLPKALRRWNKFEFALTR